MAMRRKGNHDGYYARLTLLKKLFWLYFLLLIFEGALRKWVAPQLSGPLLVIRDPVGLMIIWEAYRTNKWPQRWTVPITILTLGLVGLCLVQVIVGDNPWLVGLFGLRSYLLPFPVALIMGENIDREDLRKLGTWTIFLLLPITALAVAQYVSPSNSFLNKGAYQGGLQIAFVGEHVRASSTFSFVNGLEDYVAMAAAFIAYGIVTPGFAKVWILWSSAFALILSIPMMGSRTVVIQLALMVGCMALGALMGVSQFLKVLRIVLPVVIVVFLVSLLPVFSDAMNSMTERFTGANAAEGGGSVRRTLSHRVVVPITDVLDSTPTGAWMGIGLGRGAVAVQEFLLGSNEAVAGENEISREIGEMGPIAGIAYSLFKLQLAIAIFLPALARVRKSESLALLMIPLVLTLLFFGVPEQPTTQGFMVLSLALCIAAAKTPAQATVERKLPRAIQRQQMPIRRRVLRG